MGRPRSERAHQQVLEAALKLFSERGIAATSMDAIAEASGVSKATIYKHWADKDALCLEAMAHAHGLDEEPPHFHGDDVRTALIRVLSHRPREEYAAQRARLVPHFIAHAARNPDFGMAWRSRAMEPPRRYLRQILKRGVEEGLFPADLNYDLSLALLIGPIMYSHFLSPSKNNTKTLPEGLPEQIVEAFWKAHAITKPARGRARETHRSRKHKS
ncbi:MAG TPA: TetR/AcrR family transcriptional regulator [Blastocatellia bacterium]|nr:TetR/AcrR family transcriptional regulator [Blastocatellia bacterium]